MEPPKHTPVFNRTYPGCAPYPSEECRPIYDNEYLIRVFVKMRRGCQEDHDTSHAVTLYSVFNQVIYNTKYKLPLPCSPMQSKNLRHILFDLAKEESSKRALIKEDFIAMNVIYHHIENELFYYDITTKRRISYEEYQKRYNQWVLKAKTRSMSSQSVKLPSVSSGVKQYLSSRRSKSTK